MQPEILSASRSDGGVELALRVPDALPVWPGHFPAFFVVPGVLQLDWVVSIAASRLGAGRPVGIEAAKFKSPLRPGQPFMLSLRLAEDGRRLEFRMQHEHVVFATGRLQLEPPGS
jgi:3-hydroxymyristoyl/3-hydroxydecanoyl-(acyl carrier protein) dehydratase